MLTKKFKDGSTALEIISKRLTPQGYRIRSFTLDSAHFGVPQSRTRAFIVITGSGANFKIPHATHSPNSSDAQQTLFASPLLPSPTVHQAISDLPVLAAGEGDDHFCEYSGAPTSSYQSEMRRGSSGVYNHVAMKHTGAMVKKFAMTPPGYAIKPSSDSGGFDGDTTPELFPKPFKYNNFRLDPDKPSPIIPAAFQSLFVHPVADRNITAREAARLLSFPDTFTFKGKRTAMSWEANLSQYNQIGNSVCPKVAFELAKSTEDYMETDGSFAYISLPSKSELNSAPAEEAAEKLLLLNKYPVSRELRSKLRLLGKSVLAGRRDLDMAGDHFVHGQFKIPLEAIPVALLVSTNHFCKVCREDLKPFGSHLGEMPFLISKERTGSLIISENDHGLDFHLRSLLEVDHQCAHFVGELLEELALAKLLRLVNVRTGRYVRGVSILRIPHEIETLREEFFASHVSE